MVQQAVQASASAPACAAEAAPVRWYILRYGKLSSHLQGLIEEHQSQIFFPQRKSVRSTGEGTAVLKPCVPGYIFVQGPLSRALALSAAFQLPLWRKDLTEEECKSTEVYRKGMLASHLHAVSDEEMVQFRQVVNYMQNDIELVDATDIDLEQHDEVEFIAGPMRGRHGYVRVDKRKAGRLVIVPLLPGRNRRGRLHCGIRVKPEEYRICRFANSGRNRDCVKRANAKVRGLLKAYCQGACLSEKDRKCLKGYILRYTETEGATHTQRANLVLLLCRIYTILEAPVQLEDLRMRAARDILPTFQERIRHARGCHKAEVARKEESFCREMKAIEAAYATRRQHLAAQAPTT